MLAASLVQSLRLHPEAPTPPVEATGRAAPAPTAEPVGGEGHHRSPARYLWAMLIARIYEPTKAPMLSPARHCATQSCFACVPAQAFHGLGVRCSLAAHPPTWETFDQTPVFDPLAPAPEPAFEFDQRITR